MISIALTACSLRDKQKYNISMLATQWQLQEKYLHWTEWFSWAAGCIKCYGLLTAAECPMCKSATNIMVKAYCNGGSLHKGASNYESWKCWSHVEVDLCLCLNHIHTSTDANFTKCEGRPFWWTTHKRIMLYQYNILHFKHGCKWDSLNRLERRSETQRWWNHNVHSIQKITLIIKVLQSFKHVCRNTCARLQSNNSKSCL